MKRDIKSPKLAAAFFAFLLAALFLAACGSRGAQALYNYEEFPLERKGISLHLDRVQLAKNVPTKNILLVHGVTYSSHEFDIDFKDYSLVRKLAREGWAVWRLDIAGFGRSQEVKDGFMPDSDYAAEDINAAVEMICEITKQDKIDLLGIFDDAPGTPHEAAEAASADGHVRRWSLPCLRRSPDGLVVRDRVVARALAARVSCPDPHSSEERRARREADRAALYAKYKAKSWLGMTINRLLFRHYRSLTRLLQKKGIIPANSANNPVSQP